MIFFLFLFLIGCAGVPGVQQVTPNQALGVGAVGGVAVSKATEKVKEVFTPEFHLLVRPVEICDIEGEGNIKCHLLPCDDDKQCVIEYNRDEWLANNRKVLTVRRSLFVSVISYCEKNKLACKNYIGYYEGEKIIIVEDKEK